MLLAGRQAHQPLSHVLQEQRRHTQRQALLAYFGQDVSKSTG